MLMPMLVTMTTIMCEAMAMTRMPMHMVRVRMKKKMLAMWMLIMMTIMCCGGSLFDDVRCECRRHKCQL